MTDTFRAMCIELVDSVELLLEMRAVDAKPMAITEDRVSRARALLAEQPVSPPYTLPEPVAHQDKLDRLIALDRAQPEPEGPTDDEIEEWADDCSEAPLEEMDPEVHGWRRCFTAKEFSETIRAALDRWGRPTPQPPADAEAAELAAELRHFVAGYQQMRGLDPEHVYSIHRGDAMEAHLRVSRLSRIAELLGRPTPQPVAVSEHPWERDGWCDEQGRCWWTANKPGPMPPSWWMVSIPQSCTDGIMLPAHALPTPEATND